MKAVNILERTLQFGISITQIISDIPATYAKIVRDQALRSGTSIGANIVEAQSSSSKKEFQRYIQIALRSS